MQCSGASEANAQKFYHDMKLVVKLLYVIILPNSVYVLIAPVSLAQIIP